MNPLKNLSGDEEKLQQSLFESEITGNTRQRQGPVPRDSAECFACRPLQRIYVNVELSSRPVKLKC